MGSVINPAEHVGLVWLVAKHYAQRSRVDVEDLVQEGAIGLMKAVEKFDPERGTQFSTYAVWWIRASILLFLREKRRLVHLPHNAYDQLLKKDMVPPEPMSFDAPIPRLEGAIEGFTLHDALADESALNPEDVTAKSEERAIVWREVSKLPLREQKVLRMIYVEGVSGEVIGERFGVTRQRIDQIHQAVLKKLRPRLEAALT